MEDGKIKSRNALTGRIVISGGPEYNEARLVSNNDPSVPNLKVEQKFGLTKIRWNFCDAHQLSIPLIAVR